MESKNIHNKIELTLWIIIISALILTNLSFSAIAKIIDARQILFLLTITGCAIVLAIDKPIKNNLKYKKRFFADFIIVIFAGLLIYLTYTYIEFEHILFFLPLALAVALSSLIVIRTQWVSIILVIAFCFLLGDIYWAESIPDEKILTFPVTFLKIFSLSLVILFGFYLYKMRDETANKLMLKNKQLNSTTAELQKRTKELSNLNKRLKSLDRLKSDFISTVSHELRTPLTAIFSSAELLQKMCKKDKINEVQLNELTDIITRNIQRQTKMVENLLDLSRIEKGKTAGKRKKFKINEIAKELIETLQYTAEEKNIHLKLNVGSSKIPEIWGIPNQIQRVITNLASNAIKHSPENSKVIIDITKTNEDIKVCVNDFGPGIEKANLIKIFDRFLQLDASGAKTGAGLGLAISKEIIQAHGGNIWAESEVGEGSKFIFTIPIDLRKKKRS